jgi:hypothetical protein
MVNLSLTLTASLIILSLLIPAIQALVGKRNIYVDDKKLVDKNHLIRKAKAKVQCKSSSSKCKTAIPVDKDEDLIIVDHIISSSATTHSSNSEKPVGKDKDFIIVDPINSSIATSHPWSALRLLRAAVSPSGSEYLELELGGLLNSTWQLGNISLYLSFFSDSVFVVPTLLAAPAAFGDVVSAVGWTRDVYIYRVLLTEGGTMLLVQIHRYTLMVFLHQVTIDCASSWSGWIGPPSSHAGSHRLRRLRARATLSQSTVRHY